MPQLEQPLRAAARYLAAHGKPVKIYDSWTSAADLKTTNGMNFASRPYSPADIYPSLSGFDDPQLKLNWLPGALTLNMNSVCMAPQVRPRKTNDAWRTDHLHGSIVLGAFGPNMIMATLCARGELPSAVTVQLKGERRYGLVPQHTEARIVAFLGALPDLRRDLRDLYRFLRHPMWIKAALINSKTRRNALEPFDYAGMPHSQEAQLYAALWQAQPPGLNRIQSYARPVLKARL